MKRNKGKFSIVSKILTLCIILTISASASAKAVSPNNLEVSKEFASNFIIPDVISESLCASPRHAGQENPLYSTSAPVTVKSVSGKKPLVEVLVAIGITPGSLLMIYEDSERVKPSINDFGEQEFILEPGLYYFAQGDFKSGIGFAIYVNEPAQNSSEEIKVLLNGRQLSFDQPPIIENGRTIVPLRVILEALGADVQWEQATQTVRAVREGIIITLQIGSNILDKNGEKIILDVPAKIVGDRTLIPVRAVAECFGSKVDWESATRTVTITD